MPKVSKKTIKLDKDAIKTLDVSHLAEQSLNKNDWLTAGQSEYRLYAWLSTQFNNTTILDVVQGQADLLSHYLITIKTKL